MLSPAESSRLLTIAHQAIEHCINNKLYIPTAPKEKNLTDQAGCFVTIKQEGQLRGCIGNFQSDQPLYLNVVEMAVAAATGDPRFVPMGTRDLADFSLEITVLSPLEKVDRIDQIFIGTHGLYIEKGSRRGVLLPQVATEYDWDKETFLQQTCLKAGIDADAWQSPGADIYTFTGQIIHAK